MWKARRLRPCRCRASKDGTYGIAPGWGPARGILFERNRYYGNHANRPDDPSGVTEPSVNPPKLDWNEPLFDQLQRRLRRVRRQASAMDEGGVREAVRPPGKTQPLSARPAEQIRHSHMQRLLSPPVCCSRYARRSGPGRRRRACLGTPGRADLRAPRSGSEGRRRAGAAAAVASGAGGTVFLFDRSRGAVHPFGGPRRILPAAYGQRRAVGHGTPIQVSADSSLFAELRLRQKGAITGRVLDENGVAAPRVSVLAYRARLPLRSAGSAISDDRGVYRVHGRNQANTGFVPAPTRSTTARGGSRRMLRKEGR